MNERVRRDLFCKGNYFFTRISKPYLNLGSSSKSIIQPQTSSN